MHRNPMLVSHRHRFIYTKTAKTGGTSVESYFERYCMAPGTWSRQHEREIHESEHGIVGRRGALDPANCRWWNHMPAELIRERVGKAVWNGYFKFCVVRNPFEKAVSDFYHQRSMHPDRFDASLDDREQFALWLEHAGPTPDDDKYLIDGAFCLDFAVRYEQLHADLAVVCDRVGVPWIPQDMPTFKAGIRPARASVANMFDGRSRALIEARCGSELERFGYAFEPATAPAGAS